MHSDTTKPAVLFDLGNTLAAYYHADEFAPILHEAISGVLSHLESLELTGVQLDSAMERAVAENRESPEFRFSPMAERFERIFDVSLSGDAVLANRLCRIFLQPIFAVGRVYEDTHPVLDRLRTAGYPTAIVSNMPWGSPPELWREELARLGLGSRVDATVLCGDVGWRKPARLIFDFAAESVGRRPAECVFVGDDLRWDVSGSEAAGMTPVLIDRDGRNAQYDGERISDLHQLPELIDSGAICAAG